MKKLKVYYDFPNYNMGNILLSKTRTCLLNMLSSSANNKPLIADIGCGRGHLSRSLSLMAKTIALDVDKLSLLRAKKSAKQVDFICADICHLPLKANSVDVAVVASVFEYIEKLEEAIGETKDVIKKGGILIAGYPVETAFLKIAIEMVDRNAVKIWDPHRIMEDGEVRKDYHTHKQKCQNIRDSLGENFCFICKEKIPSKYLPDLLSIYECVKFAKVK
jgi:ubiquinone/menaquinone biosynthesis C-methylase UbiE